MVIKEGTGNGILVKNEWECGTKTPTSRPYLTKKLYEQLSTYPSNYPIKVNWWQVMVNVRLGEG